MEVIKVGENEDISEFKEFLMECVCAEYCNREDVFCHCDNCEYCELCEEEEYI